MKILFVTNQIPFPPDNGVRIVSHHAMRLMHEAGHKLALAVLTEENDDCDLRMKNISDFCETGMSWWMPLPKRNRFVVQLKAMLTHHLFFIERYSNLQFRDRISRLIDQFKPDVVHFDLIPMTQYYDQIPSNIGMVASINDSYGLTLENELSAGYYSNFKKIYRKFQLQKVRNYESNIYQKFDSVHVMTEVDANYLQKLNPKIRTVAIPNGVDPSLMNITADTYSCSTVVFVANLVAENLVYLQHFLEQGWPVVLAEYPDAKFQVVGKVRPEVVALKERSEKIPGVSFKGYVDCLADAYRGCGISIVPVNKNCGIVNKAIEAMAAGLAVIGFDKTFAGITYAEKDVHSVSVPDYEGMGHAVVKLIKNESVRKFIQESAHIMAKEYYSWESRADAYESMYQNVNKLSDN